MFSDKDYNNLPVHRNNSFLKLTINSDIFETISQLDNFTSSSITVHIKLNNEEITCTQLKRKK